MGEINWDSIQKVFFVGIKGVGLMPLSLIAKEYGFDVAGSDIEEEFITDEVLQKEKIRVYKGFNTSDIKDFFADTPVSSCLVITTGAHKGYDNPLVLWAKENSINVLNHGQALGVFMDGTPFKRELRGITVTGSHGKTTISSMLSSALTSFNMDPTYSVGTSEIFSIGNSGHYGKGEYFIAEGDEYVGEPVYDKTPKILYQSPEIAIVNNIDFDHPDVYRNIEEVKETIIKFLNNIKPNGSVYINCDDKNLIDVKNKIREDLRIVTFGESADSDFKISDIKSRLGLISFIVEKKGRLFGEFTMNIPGIHNAYNFLAVISVLDTLGKDINDIKKAISDYKGCKRRMELVGYMADEVMVLDDYGHHPAEIRSTLKAVKDFYGKKIVAVFQSHTYSRTKEFLDEFADSFDEAEQIILLPIFRSLRDSESDIISDDDFVKAFNINKDVYYAKNMDEAVQHINGLNLGKDYLLITIGAGNVYKIGYKLTK